MTLEQCRHFASCSSTIRVSFFCLDFAVLRAEVGGESEGASGVLAGEALVLAPTGDTTVEGKMSNMLPRDCVPGVKAVGRAGRDGVEAAGDIWF